ncbi:hypothetical protein EV663_11728 [Rhodovulum bhavnagarense]|uniref:Hemolytic protein HlpA-like protein n=1 Tax=Rhodovulum bhavnagarense TaxID=992286 RepID=A0A4R2R6S6_9RHOB|nr:glycosyltransferase family 2 protein [Rhodovulum bhavnagarense]TCP58762.1 hypothetical protein EV663_11728 [Rhodovulum bhavnagarense]
MTPPILFLTFNRPDTTARVFEAIRAARPARLYVAADGPRPDRAGEAERCAEVRCIATAVDWPCEVKTLFRNENLGCRRAVSGAITWFFENEPEGIILEDDCLPDPSFFTFCAEMLERYRNDPRIMCVTGNNFQTDMGDWPYSYYYSIYNHIWGWASWRRAWALYDADLERFNSSGARNLLAGLSKVPGFRRYWSSVFERVKSGNISSAWDYSWTWTCWLNSGWTCTPCVNLVSNIGFGIDATHTINEESSVANLPVVPLLPPYAAPPTIAAEPRFDDHVTREVFRGVRAYTPGRRVVKRFRHLAGRMLRSVGMR